MLFSQRIGKKPKEKPIQIDSIDEELRNGLWSLIYTHIYLCVNQTQQPIPIHKSFLTALWLHLFKKPIDELERYRKSSYLLDDNVYFDYDYFHTMIRNWFFKAQWHEIYDFLEFIACHHPLQDSKSFTKTCNKILEKEYSAYRFTGNRLIKILEQTELEGIEEALAGVEKYKLEAAKNHLDASIGLFSNRKNPDFRNSIKESISAIESLCKIICNKPNTTLGDALKRIEKDGIIELHPALKEAYCKIYGYTSDKDGIRHAMLDKSNVDFDDAKYMLVSSCAFVNYLIAKSIKANINLRPSTGSSH